MEKIASNPVTSVAVMVFSALIGVLNPNWRLNLCRMGSISGALENSYLTTWPRVVCQAYFEGHYQQWDYDAMQQRVRLRTPEERPERRKQH